MNTRSRVLGAISVVALFLPFASCAIGGDTPQRLKFRGKGPVCSCESGTGEKEISQAMKRLGLERLQADGPESQGESKKDDGQKRRTTDEDGN